MEEILRSARIVQLLAERGIMLVGETRVLGSQWDFVLEDPDAAAARIRLRLAADAALRGGAEATENLPPSDPQVTVDTLQRLDVLAQGAGGPSTLVRLAVEAALRGGADATENLPPGDPNRTVDATDRLDEEAESAGGPSALGRYAGIIGTSDDFARRKQDEIDLEDRPC